MKKLIGGTLALIIGFLGLAFWWYEFLTILKGVVPIIFVLGGILFIYQGIQHTKTTTASSSGREKKK
jgi:hypothetical protein